MQPDGTRVQDEDRLAELGYKQELRRDWSMLHNFGVSFSIIVSGALIPLFLRLLLLHLHLCPFASGDDQGSNVSFGQRKHNMNMLRANA